MEYLTTPDYFGKYSVRITAETAQTLLTLLETADYMGMNREQIMDLNGLHFQLKAIIEESQNGRSI